MTIWAQFSHQYIISLQQLCYFCFILSAICSQIKCGIELYFASYEYLMVQPWFGARPPATLCRYTRHSDSGWIRQMALASGVGSFLDSNHKPPDERTRRTRLRWHLGTQKQVPQVGYQQLGNERFTKDLGHPGRDPGVADDKSYLINLITTKFCKCHESIAVVGMCKISFWPKWNWKIQGIEFQ